MQTGDLISGKYRLQRVLGAGSMGSVWAARNELTDRDFAVKFLLPELSKNEEALNRFFLEARACGQIRHPAIVDVYDMGTAEDGSPYLVMELLEGEAFDQRIVREGRQRPAKVCRWVSTVARGLEAAHGRGLVHRDLKPGNIFFTTGKNGEELPKVLDFGISKTNAGVAGTRCEFVRTSTGTVLGSPAYMSPEQAQGTAEIDARTDVWSLGVMMYEALAGKLPFDAPNYNALMQAIINEPHLPLNLVTSEVPLELSELVDETLKKNRVERIAGAGPLAERLERIYAKLTTTPLSAPERPSPLDQTHSAWFQIRGAGRGRLSPVALGLGAITLILLLGAAAVLLGGRRAQPAAQVARLSPGLSLAVERARTQIEKELREREQEAREEAEERAARQEAAATTGAGSAATLPGQPPGPLRPPAKADPKDPHGGVESSGF